MRELMPEKAGGEATPSRKSSIITLADKELVYPGQAFPDHCGGWKCKDWAHVMRR
jgi:hypothetical protein